VTRSPSNASGAAEAQKLCVAQILPALQEGGVERGTLEISEALIRRGHRSLVISAGGGMVEALLSHGAEHVQMAVGKKSPWTFRLVPRLRRLLVEAQVDILHARSRFPAWLAFLAWRGLPPAGRPRFVTTVHGFYSVSAYSAVMTRGERVIAVSNAVRGYLLDNYRRIDPERIEVIHRGVDDAVFYPQYRPHPDWTSRWASMYPALEGRVVVTLAGRLSRLKGHDDFIEVIARLAGEGLPVHGLVVGDDTGKRHRYAASLKATVEHRGLPVTFTGRRDDLRDIFAAADVVVSLSRKPESFGRTVLEALALGVPVVGYDHGGVGEILNACFPQGAVPPGDLHAVVKTILGIHTQKMKVKTRNPFPLEHMLESTLRLYEKLTRISHQAARN
jgi:glycosyltransferase involved in cell wall biosynthesis